MSFWSGEKLADTLPSLVRPYAASNLDCASYRLSVGEEVFVTSDKFQTGSPTDPLVSILSKQSPANILRIHPGQFAFLLTEEEVDVPEHAMALISMRAGYKFKGLINVSGFHVDPGWSGKLLFSVYNAGPSEIIVRRGEPMFLIVYADLDRTSNKTYVPTAGKQMSIKTDLLQNMTGQVFSPLMLQRRMTELDAKLNSVTTDFNSELIAVKGIVNTFTAVTVSVTGMAGLLIATAALFATFAPATLGVILARTIDLGGYDLRLKLPDSQKAADGNPEIPKNSAPGANAPKEATTPPMSNGSHK